MEESEEQLYYMKLDSTLRTVQMTRVRGCVCNAIKGDAALSDLTANDLAMDNDTGGLTEMVRCETPFFSSRPSFSV